MAGLESIALAVAHLERMQDDSEEKDGEKQTESNSKESPPPSSPFQQSQARMVSSDQRPDKALDKDKQKDGTADSATANTLVSEAEAIAEQAAGAAAAVATTHRHNFDVSTGTEPKDASAANAADPAETKDLLGMPLAPMEREKAEPSSSKGRRGKTPEGKPRSQWGMSLSRTTGKRGPNGELIDEGPVASLVAKLSVVTDNLELYFGLMDQVKALAEGTAAPLPKPEDPVPRVQVNDVLLGRGGETNHHVGNIEYRRLVKASQPAYLAAKRRDKPRIAASIVQVVRARSGKFLKKMPGDNNWHDVGNNRAREKTSQALREGKTCLFAQPRGMRCSPSFFLTSLTFRSDSFSSSSSKARLSCVALSRRPSKRQQTRRELPVSWSLPTFVTAIASRFTMSWQWARSFAITTKLPTPSTPFQRRIGKPAIPSPKRQRNTRQTLPIVKTALLQTIW